MSHSASLSSEQETVSVHLATLSYHFHACKSALGLEVVKNTIEINRSEIQRYYQHLGDLRLLRKQLVAQAEMCDTVNDPALAIWKHRITNVIVKVEVLWEGLGSIVPELLNQLAHEIFLGGIGNI
ncbi:MAG: hypothetical protein L6R41_005297 [Letrouitia leprolyta]|nr:MAG: hypothetical protein L6R41_005297 [Letrouitia leprolyta]